jgi:catechol 2,3-dioxygenase-like lactoylglutathione lyase family enzyme
MLKKVDHVTLVVKDLNKTLKSYQKIFSLTPQAGSGFIRDFPDCKLAMLDTPDGARIEFMEPKPGIANHFTRFLDEHGEGVCGICFYLDDFEAEVRALKLKGVPVEEEQQALLFPDKPFRIAWVPPEDGHGVWLELVDVKALPDFEL